ncbi:gliding motility-associated C-terminal domain-containing protein [Jejudonia soesokkakensis]|uniref:Gliding motility-associated C-terminal domain-containing protein n=1 Tax=Jejudonia soesokkakensis TaxID=1323432 RepID=A0ABW2MR27_9FLAO
MKKLLHYTMLHQFHRSLCNLSKSKKTLLIAIAFLFSGGLFAQAPANDLCADAIAINCGDTLTGNTSQATNTGDPMDGCGTSDGAPGVWYSFAGTGDIVSLGLCNSDYDTKLRVYNGDCNTLQCVAGNDDSCGLQSEVTFISQTGTNYLVYVFGFGSATGAYELTIACDTPPDPPANDECDTAIVVTPNSGNECTNITSGTIAGATLSTQPNTCIGTADDDVWFEYTSISESAIIELLNITGSTTNLNLSVFEGTDCNALSLVACSEAGDEFIIAQSGFTIGNTYKIRVWSNGSNPLENTTFDLCIRPNLPPQECLDADPFCSMDGLIFENESGDAVAPPNIDYECLGSQPDPSWFFLQIEESGDLSFEIIQNTSFDSQGNPNGQELDVDFIAWGPFPDRASGCGNLNPSTSIDCSFSPAPVENFDIPNAMAGDVYILLITNFSQDPGFISLQQTNFGDPGTGTTDCDIVFECAITINGGDQTVCGVDDLTLTTSTNGPVETFQWFFNDVLIDGETNSSITVSESGGYKVIADGVDCDMPVEDTVTIVFQGVDIMTALPSNLDVCTDFEPLDATPTNPGVDLTTVTYEWTNANGDILSTEAMYSPTDIGTLMVTVTVPPCSTETFTIEVEATTALSVQLNEDFRTCPGELNTLTATTDVQGATFQWFLNGDPIPGETSSTLEFMVPAGTNGTQTYSVEITAGLCTGSDAVDVSLYDIANCIISEGLSPNGSPGFNDSLDLEFLADRTGISQVQIFNRLGRLVFQQSNYINEWRGQSDDGNDLPSGTYYYVIDFAGDDPLYGRQATGWIYLNQEAK